MFERFPIAHKDRNGKTDLKKSLERPAYFKDSTVNSAFTLAMKLHFKELMVHDKRLTC